MRTGGVSASGGRVSAPGRCLLRGGGFVCSGGVWSWGCLLQVVSGPGGGSFCSRGVSAPRRGVWFQEVSASDSGGVCIPACNGADTFPPLWTDRHLWTRPGSDTCLILRFLFQLVHVGILRQTYFKMWHTSQRQIQYFPKEGVKPKRCWCHPINRPYHKRADNK